MATPAVTDGLTTIRKGEASERRTFLAADIEAAAGAFKKILASGLNEKAIVLLVAEESGVGKTEVRAVLKALGNLHSTYCR